MEPTLRPGGIILAVWVPSVRVGHVVIIEHGGIEKIKRIAKVRPGQIYVVGDNDVQSTDSRQFGWIDSSQVVGRVVWPRAGAKYRV